MPGPCGPTSASRPAFQVADILRARFDRYRTTYPLTPVQHRAANALMRCRTASLGGFASQCDDCGTTTVQYASCRNRHCPKCQTLTQTRWVERQCDRLLDIGYWHVVFTLPHELNGLARRQPALVYRLLFRAASETLLEFGRNPRWLGGEIGVTMVLHTWGQNLGQHIHVHAIVTGGARSPDGQRWLSPRHRFLFPTRAMSAVFRGKYLDFLDKASRRGELPQIDRDDAHDFDWLMASLRERDWVVYAKRPFANAARVLAYLGRYTHKVAVSNHRLVDFDGEQVRFRWRDYADGNRRKVMCLQADEFVRRFLLHVLPRGFTRVRHYGLPIGTAAGSPQAVAPSLSSPTRRSPNRRRRRH